MDVANLKWMIGEKGRIYHYAFFENASRMNSGRPAVHAISIFETARAPYRLTRHTFVERADLNGGRWNGIKGWTQTFGGDLEATREDFASRRIDLPGVDDFRRSAVDATTMTYTQLREYVRRLGASGFNVAEQAVELQHKIAFPAVTIVMTLLAIPFGATTGRKGAMYGIGLATVLAGSYFLVLTLSLAVGAAGVLPPALAAWAPNLIFGAGAVFMMFSVRT
jgi:lipopolysaccharide export LptBFGC system permease protein LptF